MPAVKKKYCMTTQTVSIRTVARWCSRWWEIEGTRSKSPQSSLSNYCHFRSVPVVVGAPSGLMGALCLDTFLHIICLVYDMLYIYIDNYLSVYTKIKHICTKLVYLFAYQMAQKGPLCLCHQFGCYYNIHAC